MKDSRFIDLLNLYIDRQISVTETAELEAEIQQNPKRQAVYRQYCQIHSATKLVYDSFRAHAPEQPVLPADRTGVVELFETKRRRNHLAYYAAGGLAAAACLTLVFMRHNSTPPAGLTIAANPTEVRSTPPTPAPVQVATVAPVKMPEPAVSFVSLRNAATNTPDYSAMLAVLREQDQERAIANGNPPAAPIHSLFDDGLFNANRVVPAQDSKLFRIQQTSGSPGDSTVFQFQR